MRIGPFKFRQRSFDTDGLFAIELGGERMVSESCPGPGHSQSEGEDDQLLFHGEFSLLGF
jgi:hypothetical protein